MQNVTYLFFILIFLSCSSESQQNNTVKKDGEISVVFANTLEDYPVQVFTEDDKGKEEYVETIGAKTEYEFTEASPRQIFYFKPKGNSNYEILPFTVDTLKTQRYELELAQKRYGESKNSYKRITNAMANRYSFDIAKIDPFKIDADEKRGGGRKKQIFEELSDFDRDWYPFDGDFAVKKQFDVQFINEGKSLEKSELFKSMSSFQKEYTASIDASASYKGVTGTASASWSKLTKNGQDTESLFSWFRKEDQKYFIELRPEHVKLDAGFVAAIGALPIPEALPSTIKEAAAHKTFDDYYEFVKEWGTHYPEKVTYGGIIQGSLNASRTQVTQLVEKGFGVKAGLSAPIKGGETGIGGGYDEKQIEELENITKSSHKEYAYKGGEGHFESWAVGDEVQPIYIALNSLADLLKTEYLPEEEQVIAKRRMLQFAIDNYLQEFPIPSPEENDLIAYELICLGVEFPNSSDADKPYHSLDRVRVSMWPGINKKMIKEGVNYALNTNGVVWEIKKGDQVISIPEKSRKKYDDDKRLEMWNSRLQKPKMIFMIDPKQVSKTERDKINIRFYARFEEDDGWDKKDEVAKGGTYAGIALKDVGRSFKKYTLSVKESDKDWDKSKINADVFYKIRKINLFE